MTKYYLAVDIGASSGRLILGHLENGKMELEEVHRFENGMVKKDGELCWEFDRLFQEIKNGLKKCKEIGKIPVSYQSVRNPSPLFLHLPADLLLPLYTHRFSCL